MNYGKLPQINQKLCFGKSILESLESNVWAIYTTSEILKGFALFSFSSLILFHFVLPPASGKERFV